MCWPRDKGVGQNGGWKIQRTSLRDLEMHQSRDNVCVGSCSSKPKLYPEKSYKGLSPWTGAGWGGKRHWQISNKMEIFLRIHSTWNVLLWPCVCGWHFKTWFSSYVLAVFLIGICTQLLNSVQLFCDPMDCILPGSSVHGISLARIPSWVAISFSRGSSQTRDQTHISSIGRQVLYHRVSWDDTPLMVSVQFSHSVMSDSLWPQGLQYIRLPCPSNSNSCPSSQWCYPTISSTVVPFSSCLQSFPAPGSFPTSQFFPSGGQRIGASASALVLPMNIQD